jgi:hypothetical protein
LLRPFKGGPVEVERLVVRLALVLENLEQPMSKGSWRQMLHLAQGSMDGAASLRVEEAVWRYRDGFFMVGLSVLLLVVGVSG